MHRPNMNWVLVFTALCTFISPAAAIWCDHYPWDCSCVTNVTDSHLHNKRIGFHDGSFYRCDSTSCHKTSTMDFSHPNSIDWVTATLPEDIQLFGPGSTLTFDFGTGYGGQVWLTSDEDGAYMSNEATVFCKDGPVEITNVTEVIITGDFDTLSMEDYRADPASYDEEFLSVISEAYQKPVGDLSAVTAQEGSLKLTTVTFVQNEKELPETDFIDAKSATGFAKALKFRQSQMRVRDARNLLQSEKTTPKRKDIMKQGARGKFQAAAIKTFAYAAKYGPPVSTLQQAMDEYCNSVDSIKNQKWFARKDTGTASQNTREWRCYKPSTLDFSVTREDGCMNECGYETECQGARTGPRSGHVNANSALLAIAEARKGTVPDPTMGFQFDVDSDYTVVADDDICEQPQPEITLAYTIVRTCHGEVAESVHESPSTYLKFYQRSGDAPKLEGTLAISSMHSSAYPASKCQDGNPSTFCHTKGDVNGKINPWARMSLASSTYVEYVQIKNRENCCKDRLDTFEVWIGSNAGTYNGGGNVKCFSGQATSNQLDITASCRETGRYVFVVLPGTDRVLNLAEIETYGKPTGVCYSTPALTVVDPLVEDSTISHILIWRFYAGQWNLVASKDANDKRFVLDDITLGARLPAPVSKLQKKLDDSCQEFETNAVARKQGTTWWCLGRSMMEDDTPTGECVTDCTHPVTCYGKALASVNYLSYGAEYTALSDTMTALVDQQLASWINGPPQAVARYYKYEGAHWDKGMVKMQYKMIRECNGQQEASGFSPVAEIPYSNDNYQVPIFELQHDHTDASILRVEIWVDVGGVMTKVETVPGSQTVWLAHDNPTITKAPTPYVTTKNPTTIPTEAPTKAAPPTTYATQDYWKTNQLSVQTVCPQGQVKSSDNVCVDDDECSGTNWRDFLRAAGCPNPFVSTHLAQRLEQKSKSEAVTFANTICEAASQPTYNHVQCKNGIQARGCSQCGLNNCETSGNSDSGCYVENHNGVQTCKKKIKCNNQWVNGCGACSSCNQHCQWKNSRCQISTYRPARVTCATNLFADSCSDCMRDHNTCTTNCEMVSGECTKLWLHDESLTDSLMTNSYSKGFAGQDISWERAACCGNDYESCPLTFGSCPSSSALAASSHQIQSVWTDASERCDSANTGRTCVNTFGSFKCKCPEGFTYDPDWTRMLGDEDEECQVLPINFRVNVKNTMLKVDITQESRYSANKFQVTLGEWDFNEATADDLKGYPTPTVNRLLEVRSLPPGAPLKVSIDPWIGDTNTGAYSVEHRVFETVYLTCGCQDGDWAVTDAEKTGQPSSIKVWQDMGFVKYEWVDNSMCEAGFSFYRKDGMGVKTSFAEDFMYVSSEKCGQIHSPDFVKDDIVASNLELGSIYEYCVLAVGPRTMQNPYFSAPQCIGNFVIKWESVLTGKFTLNEEAGRLPVKDVVIDWVVIGREVDLFGTVKTDDQGEYKIHVLAEHMFIREQKMRVNFTKTTGTIDHEFECGGKPCTRHLVALNHLEFGNKFDVVDTTAKSFSGKVLVGGTKHAALTKGCPFIGVDVCLRLASGEETGCTETDADGYYELPAIVGTSVTPLFRYGRDQKFVSSKEQHTYESTNNTELANHFSNLKLAGCPSPYIKADEMNAYDTSFSSDLLGYTKGMQTMCNAVSDGTATDAQHQQCCGFASLVDVAFGKPVLVGDFSHESRDKNRIVNDHSGIMTTSAGTTDEWAQVHISHESVPLGQVTLKPIRAQYSCQYYGQWFIRAGAYTGADWCDLDAGTRPANYTADGFIVGMSTVPCVPGKLEDSCHHSSNFQMCAHVTDHTLYTNKDSFDIECAGASGKYLTVIWPGADRHISLRTVKAQAQCGNYIEDCGYNKNIAAGLEPIMSGASGSNTLKAATDGYSSNGVLTQTSVDSANPWIQIPLHTKLAGYAPEAATNVQKIHVGEVNVYNDDACPHRLFDKDCEEAPDKSLSFAGIKVGLSLLPCAPGTACTMSEECGTVTTYNSDGTNTFTVDCAGKEGKYVIVQAPGAQRTLAVQEITVMGHSCTLSTGDILCKAPDVFTDMTPVSTDSAAIDHASIFPEDTAYPYTNCLDDNAATFCASSTAVTNSGYRTITIDMGSSNSMHSVNITGIASHRLHEFEIWVSEAWEFSRTSADLCFSGHFNEASSAQMWMDVPCSAKGRYLQIRAPEAVYSNNAPNRIALAEIKLNKLYETQFYISEDANFEDMDYVGISTKEVEVFAVASACNFGIPQTNFTISMASCPSWQRVETVPARTQRQVVSVPIQQLEFTHTATYTEDGTSIDPVYDDYFAKVLGPRKTITHDLMQLQAQMQKVPVGADEDQVASVEQHNAQFIKSVRFEYRTAPILDLECEMGRCAMHNCQYDAGERAGKPMMVAASNTDVPFNIFAHENYGTRVCREVPGHVIVTSNVGETYSYVQSTKAKNEWHLDEASTENIMKCNSTEPCARELAVPEDQEASTNQVLFRIGRPSLLRPHTKNIRLTMHTAPYPLTILDIPIYVTGTIVLGKFGSVAFPKYMPILVVHDPPGGMSYAYYKAHTMSMKISIEGYVAHKSWAMGGSLKIGYDPHETKMYSPMPVTVGESKSNTKLQVTLGGGAFGGDETKHFEQHSQTTHTVTIKYDMETSQTPGLPGKRSDMYLIPIFQIFFVETLHLAWDTLDCKVGVTKQIEWMPSTAQGGLPAFGFLSEWDIVNKEIPTLQAAIDVEQALFDETQDQALVPHLNKMKVAVLNWQLFVEQNDWKYKNATACYEDKDVCQELGLNTIANTQSSGGTVGMKIPLPLGMVASLGVPQDIGIQTGHNNAFDVSGMSMSPRNIMNPDSFTDDISAGSRRLLGLGDMLADMVGTGPSMHEKLSPIYSEGTIGRNSVNQVNDESMQQQQDVSWFKFSGGGNMFQFEEDKTQMYKHRKQERSGKEGGLDLEFDLSIHAVGIKVMAQFAMDDDVVDIVDTDNITDTATGATRGFAMGDLDLGDVFDVKVFEDPKYKTFLFLTTSGFSKCPHESGTAAREVPKIAINSNPMALDASKPQLFTIQISNLGQEMGQFELFPVEWALEPGVLAKFNGRTLVNPILMENMPALSTKNHQVLVYRDAKIAGDKYEFKLKFGLRTKCETNRFLGKSSFDMWEDSYLELKPRFLEPCSTVGFYGELATGKTVYNLAKRGFQNSMLAVTVKNTNAGGTKWTADDRLQSIPIEYRQVGDDTWRTCKDREDNPIDFFEYEEPDAGILVANWDVSKLPDANFHIRVSTRCEMTLGMAEIPPGLDSFYPDPVLVVLDREAPQQFGHMEPSDREYFPGDEFSVTYNEDIDCNQPFNFDMEMAIEGVDVPLTKNELLVVCENRKITAALKDNDWTVVNNKECRFKVFNVHDVHGNKADNSTVQFKFADLDDTQASVLVRGMQLNADMFTLPDGWQSSGSLQYETAETSVVNYIAISLDVTFERIHMQTLLSECEGCHVLIATFTILPPSAYSKQDTAIEAAAALEAMVKEPDPASRNAAYVQADELVHTMIPKEENSNGQNIDSCATVEFDTAFGGAGRDGLFLNLVDSVRSEHANELLISAKNPGNHAWALNRRLTNVVAEYRTAGDMRSTWKPCVDSLGRQLQLKPMERENGLADGFWSVADVADGDYQIRLKTVCNPSEDPYELLLAVLGDTKDQMANDLTMSGDNADYLSLLNHIDEINQMKSDAGPHNLDTGSTSSAFVVKIDRARPVQFGSSEPKDGQYAPGKKMSISFSENLQCRQPYDFVVSLQVGTAVYSNADVDVVCSGRTVTVYPHRGFDWDAAVGQAATLKITGVRDEVGNRNLGADSAFEVAAVDLGEYTVEWVLIMNYADVTDESVNDATDAKHISHATELIADMAAISGQPITRFNVDSFAYKTLEQTVVAKISITADETATASSVAKALNDHVNDLGEYDENARAWMDEVLALDTIRLHHV